MPCSNQNTSEYVPPARLRRLSPHRDQCSGLPVEHSPNKRSSFHSLLEVCPYPARPSTSPSIFCERIPALVLRTTLTFSCNIMTSGLLWELVLHWARTLRHPPSNAPADIAYQYCNGDQTTVKTLAVEGTKLITSEVGQSIRLFDCVLSDLGNRRTTETRHSTGSESSCATGSRRRCVRRAPRRLNEA
jgi:hypothetical protein